VNRLEGKVALVTGATQGIGRGIAELFATEGATVVATDVRHPEVYAERIAFAFLDVTDEQQWAEVVGEIDARHGRLDVLVNNAGIIGYSPLDTLTSEEWESVIGVDQMGVWLGMRAVIPVMRRQGGGSLINMSSAWGVIGGEGAHAYAAAKGAVRSMTRNAAVTYAGDNIRANAVVPGWIHTPLTDAQPRHLIKRIETFFGRQPDYEKLRSRGQLELASYLSPVMEETFRGRGHWNNAPMHRVLMSLFANAPAIW